MAANTPLTAGPRPDVLVSPLLEEGERATAALGTVVPATHLTSVCGRPPDVDPARDRSSYRNLNHRRFVQTHGHAEMNAHRRPFAR
jgi:hypothetical protein